MEYDDLNRLTRPHPGPGRLRLRHPARLRRERERDDAHRSQGPDRVTSTYDELNRLKTKTYAFARSGSRPALAAHHRRWSYTYDANGNLSRRWTSPWPAAPIRRRPRWSPRATYDDLDRLATRPRPLPDGGTRTVAYTYFANGTRKTVTGPAGRPRHPVHLRRPEPARDRDHRLRPTGRDHHLRLLPDDLLKTVTYSERRHRDARLRQGRPAHLARERQGRPPRCRRYAYSYDHNGNRSGQVEVNGGPDETTTYTYDGLDRLATVTYPIDANYPNGRVVTYGYDDVGNRTRETERTTAGAVLADKQGVFDNLNRLTTLTDLVDAGRTAPPSPGTRTATSSRRRSAPVTHRVPLRLPRQAGRDGPGPSTPGPLPVRLRRAAATRRSATDGVSAVRLRPDVGPGRVRRGRRPEGQVRLRLRPADQPLPHRRRPAVYFHLDGLRSVVNLTDDAGSVAASYHLTPGATSGSRRSWPPQQEPLRVHRLRVGPGDWASTTRRRATSIPQLGRFLTPGLLPRPDRRPAESASVLLRERQPDPVRRPNGQRDARRQP